MITGSASACRPLYIYNTRYDCDNKSTPGRYVVHNIKIDKNSSIIFIIFIDYMKVDTTKSGK